MTEWKPTICTKIKSSGKEKANKSYQVNGVRKPHLCVCLGQTDERFELTRESSDLWKKLRNSLRYSVFLLRKLLHMELNTRD